LKRSTASVTVKLVGGPLNGKSAVAYGAVVGSLIDVNRCSYRVTKVDTIPGWSEMIASAIYIDKKKPAPSMIKPVVKPQ
jgi:hypothetical protein